MFHCLSFFFLLGLCDVYRRRRVAELYTRSMACGTVVPHSTSHQPHDETKGKAN